jgi:hypothetical protein
MSDIVYKLLPCPFCGGEPYFERKGNIRESMIIICEDCGCIIESGDVYGLTANDRLKWNRRQIEDESLRK